MTPSRTTEMTLSNDDRDFFKNAASAGQFEVNSSTVAESKATDNNVKQYAEMMVKDHAGLNDELKTLAQSKGISLPTGLRDKDEDMLEKLNKAQPGKDFDKEYTKDQVKAHKEAVSLFDNAARNSKDPDIRAFAAKVLPSLEQHGTQAKELEKSY